MGILFLIVISLLPYLLLGLIIWGLIEAFEHLFGDKSSRRRSAAVSQQYNVPVQTTVYDQQHLAAEAKNKEWLEYIRGLEATAKTKAEKELIKRILSERQHHAVQAAYPELAPGHYASAASDVDMPAVAAPAPAAGNARLVSIKPFNEAEAKNAHDIKISNTVLLLYFGAFLFVASSGLFVAFAGLAGAFRTLVVFLVMLVMYAGGFWLYGKPRLKQAGVTFVSIGMAIAPLVGVAFFNFVSNKTNAPLIWFATSALCIAMYVYVLFRIRSAITGYLVVFSFISLFESAVSILHTPTYFFIWGLLLAGIILQAVSYLKGAWLEVTEPSAISAKFIMPLMVFVSLMFVGTQGYATLSVALFLSAVYYAVEGLFGPLSYREISRVVAHVAILGGLLSSAYGFTKSPAAMGVVLLATAAGHIVGLLLLNPTSRTAINFASVALFALLLAPSFDITNRPIWLAFILLAIILGWLTGLKQNREEAVAYGSLALIAAPLIIGQVVLSTRLGAATQTIYTGAPTLVLFWLAHSGHRKKQLSPWLQTLSAIFVLTSLVTITTSLFAGRWAALITSALVALLYLVYGRLNKEKEWEVSSGFIICLPVLYTLFTGAHVYFPVSIMVALAFNIYLAVRLRHEQSRWISTILWLILPLAVGLDGFNERLPLSWFAWAYYFMAVGLVLSRSIARGVVFVSYKIPMLAYARNASFSYVFGYFAALIIAIWCAFMTNNNEFHGTIMLGAVLALLLLLAKYVEKQPVLYAAIPIFLQAILFSAVRPVNDTAGANILVGLSVGLSLIVYALSATRDHRDTSLKHVINITSLAMSYIGVLFVYSANYEPFAWAIPAGFIVSGLLLTHYYWASRQIDREVSILAVVASVFLLMLVQGIENIHVYTHVLAAAFTAFAAWRHARNEMDINKNYIWAAYYTITVPLALQAVSGVGGDMYGWLLILEQVASMLIGVMLDNRFLIWAGLYVALGAVLYQLRNLGWAAVLVLALFVIGIAIRRLYKFNQQEKEDEGSDKKQH